MPVGNGYAPYIRSKALPDDYMVRIMGLPEIGAFGQTYEIDVELSYHPRLDYSSLRPGTHFLLVEGPKTIGSGEVRSEMFVVERDGGIAGRP